MAGDVGEDEADFPPNEVRPRREPVARVKVQPTEAHLAFTAALRSAQRVAHQSEAVSLQILLRQFEQAILDEEAAGRAVEEGGALERAFVAHLGAELRCSRQAADRLLDLGFTLRDALPATMAVFAGGDCSQVQAFLVAEQVDGLTDEQTARLDAIASGYVGDLAPAALGRRLELLRARLAPEQAIDDARLAAGARTVTARPLRKGMGALTIKTTSTVIAGLYDALHQAGVKIHARAGETRTYQAGMADAAVEAILKGLALGITDGTGVDPAVPNEVLGTLEHPGSGRIQAQVTVIVPADTAVAASNEPGIVPGFGPIDAEQARHVIAVSRSWTRAEVDPVTDTIIGFDSHERFIPAALRRLIETRQPTCACGCGRPTKRTDLDHLDRVEFDGRTRHTNLQGLCRPSHLWLKDGRYMDVKLLDDGSIRWRTAWGGTRIEKPLFDIRHTTHPDEPCPF